MAGKAVQGLHVLTERRTAMLNKIGLIGGGYIGGVVCILARYVFCMTIFIMLRGSLFRSV